MSPPFPFREGGRGLGGYEMTEHEYFMAKAVEQARNALAKNEFPVGCVITYQGEMIASGFRKGSADDIPNEIDHAEIIAIRQLGKIGQSIDRSRASLYCTHGAVPDVFCGDSAFRYR